jgi:hypothetical protein
MHPSVLLRPPLVWLIAAEAIIVVLLVFASWHIWQSRQAPAPVPIPGQAVAPPAARAPGAAHLPRSPQAQTGAAPAVTPRVGPTPGIRTDPAFLSRQMDEINRVEATLEDLEWRVTRAAVDALQYYIQRVVVPAVERAMRGGR